MKGNCMIPDKIENVSLISGVDFVVDTKGLCCRMKVVGGDIVISMKENDFSRWLFSDGEEIDFCGKLCYKHSSGNPTVYLMYYHTL